MPACMRVCKPPTAVSRPPGVHAIERAWMRACMQAREAAVAGEAAVGWLVPARVPGRKMETCGGVGVGWR